MERIKKPVRLKTLIKLIFGENVESEESKDKKDED